jgi:hypothetical protein
VGESPFSPTLPLLAPRPTKQRRSSAGRSRGQGAPLSVHHLALDGEAVGCECVSQVDESLLKESAGDEQAAGCNGGGEGRGEAAEGDGADVGDQDVEGLRGLSGREGAFTHLDEVADAVDCCVLL